jgi:hypothetical protein
MLEPPVALRLRAGRGRPARAFDALVAALEADPARVGGSTVNAASLLYIVALSLNDGRMGWPRLGAALAREQRTGGRPPFPPAGAALASPANTAVECTQWPLAAGALAPSRLRRRLHRPPAWRRASSWERRATRTRRTGMRSPSPGR